MKRVVILGRGGAGKSVLARRIGELTGLPVIELDSLFWQDGLVPADPDRWAVRQGELAQRETWIMDGDLGPYDQALDVRLRAADTIVVLDFAFWRCAWRTARRGREPGVYWRWNSTYRSRYLPSIMRTIAGIAPHAQVHVLRSPRMVRRFLAAWRRS